MALITNSLGSNYSKQFVATSQRLLFSFWDYHHPMPQDELAAQLVAIFGKVPTLTYKGRHAITLAIKSLGIKPGQEVLTQAFTCWAVEEGIFDSGAKPIFVDIPNNSLNLTSKTLAQAFKKHPKAKAVLVQHTLGFPADIQKIKAFCKKNNLYLIEDLAHAFGAKDNQDRLLGTQSDAAAFSFGRDKIIDSVSGGGVISTKSIKTKISSVNDQQIVIDLLYPSLTSFIRNTGTLGKATHRLASKTPLLSTPISSPTKNPADLPSPHAQLTIQNLGHLKSQLAHRQQIAQIYIDSFKSNPHITSITQNNSIYLRFPILVNHRKKLVKQLSSRDIHLSDSWYKKPVEESKSASRTSYQTGSCPNAEALSQKILNLPTHINVTPKQARHISQTVNTLTKLNK